MVARAHRMHGARVEGVEVGRRARQRARARLFAGLMTGPWPLTAGEIEKLVASAPGVYGGYAGLGARARARAEGGDEKKLPW